MLKKIVRELLLYILAGIFVWFCILLVSDGINIKSGINEAVERCLNIIIPSLFAFMALSSMLVQSGIYIQISKPFALFSRYVMGIPEGLFSVFLLSNVAGYPVGAALLGNLCDEKRISERTAEIMQCCCYGAGPAFCTGTIGLAVYGNTRVGIVVFVSVVLSNFIIAIILGHILKPDACENDIRPHFNGEIMTNSVISAGRSLFAVCALIVFFSTIMSVLEHYNVFSDICNLLGSQGYQPLVKSLLEITSVTALNSNAYGLLPIVAAVCSFGGVCVVLQIAVCIKKRYSMKMFLITRPVSALLSAANCLWLSKLMLPDELSAYSSRPKVFVTFNNLLPSVCLILMIFLLNAKKRLVFSK